MYSPRGQTQLSARSRQFIGQLKRGDPQALPQFVARVASLTQLGHFPGFFGATVTLMPVPGSSPLVAGGLWVPLLVANALKAAGLAHDVVPAVSRITAVKKSAFAPPGERPNVQQHYNSITVQIVKPAPTNITLIDDVVTQGCTMLAVASRVANAYPSANVRGFALVRTMSNIEIDQVVSPRTNTIVSPCVGTIEPRQDRAARWP